MLRLAAIICWALLCIPSSSTGQENRSVSRVLKLMGVRFELTAVAPDSNLAHAAIDAAIAEITRIEQLISSWDPASETSAINRQAGIRPVKVSDELLQLIARSTKVSALTGGVFDISYASADRIWKFDGSQQTLPSPDAVQASVARIGYQKIQINREKGTVFLPEKGMKIGFGGIGKGYAANRAKHIMQAMGLPGGLVNAGGDLACWGRMENGEDWTIGIANPANKEEVLGWVLINDLAIVTSGNYEKFFMANGKRYAHIIDPRTGYPASGTKSVTIVCPDAELADALATAVFILGAPKGIALINRLKDVECLVVNDRNEMLSSKGLTLNQVGSAPDR